MIPTREMQAINYDASVFIIDLVDKEKAKVTSDLRWNYLAHCKVVPYIAGMMVFNFVFMVHLRNYMKPSLIPEENGMCQLYDNVSLLTMITTEPDIFENFWSLTKTDFAKTVGLDHLFGKLSVKRGSPAGPICDKSIASAMVEEKSGSDGD